VIPYEQKLDTDAAWALREGGWHFERESSVHKCLRRIACRLEELRIPYAVAGGMALFFHGYRRFTEDVDILVTAEGLKAIHDRLQGLGWVAPSSGSRQLRDPESGIRIDFLVTGEFPGDGKPQPIAFPPPDESVVVLEGIRFLGLLKLVELKLASGAAPGRRRDWADVQELIRTLNLPADFADRLDPSVRHSFQQLWTELHPPAQAG
jgi:hypothetical protein